jgi:predicted metal-dependent phosphoesterase TrpH
VIDLHLHTTASDGLLEPSALVERAAAAGLSTIAVTDHDTVGGIAAARDAGIGFGVRVIAGIEVTAVENGRDLHILGYFFDPLSAALGRLLTAQRADRIRRVREIGARLGDLGYPLDVEPLLSAASQSGRSIGRPAIADALVAAGHCADRNDAFARLLGRGCPAFVPRDGTSPAAVVEIIHEAHGIASLAHPGISAEDALIERLVSAGLDAIEVWHSDHSAGQQQHYGELADRLNVAKTGGSDYHGDGVHRVCRLGGVVLPATELARLEELAAWS